MTGLEPAEQLSHGWEEALRTFGKMNDVKIMCEKRDLYGAFVKSECPAITDEDLCLINTTVINQARNEVSE